MGIMSFGKKGGGFLSPEETRVKIIKLREALGKLVPEEQFSKERALLLEQIVWYEKELKRNGY